MDTGQARDCGIAERVAGPFRVHPPSGYSIDGLHTARRQSLSAADRTYARYADIIELLRMTLDSYGHLHLDPVDTDQQTVDPCVVSATSEPQEHGISGKAKGRFRQERRLVDMAEVPEPDTVAGWVPDDEDVHIEEDFAMTLGATNRSTVHDVEAAYDDGYSYLLERWQPFVRRWSR